MNYLALKLWATDAAAQCDALPQSKKDDSLPARALIIAHLIIMAGRCDSALWRKVENQWRRTADFPARSKGQKIAHLARTMPSLLNDTCGMIGSVDSDQTNAVI